MARLPQPGGDNGHWGDILNDYLSQSHNSDGTLADDSVGGAQLKPNAVTSGALAPGSVTTSALASDAVTSAIIADGSITNTNIADITITKPKLSTSIQASLDKADSALQSAPVSNVAGKTGDVTLDKSDVGLGNVDNTADADKPVSGAMQLALDLKLDTATASSTYAPKHSPTFTGSLTTLSLKVTAGNPASGKILTSDTDGNATWQSAPTAPVTSVNSKTGAVTLDKSDVGLSNVDNTSDATKNSASATLTNKIISGSNNTLSNIAQSSVTNLTSDLTAKAAKGANNDITSLSGLTTALSVAQGGTGSSTQNFVDLTTNQTVAGVKTFSNSIVENQGHTGYKVPAATSTTAPINTGANGSTFALTAPLGTLTTDIWAFNAVIAPSYYTTTDGTTWTSGTDTGSDIFAGKVNGGGKTIDGTTTKGYRYIWASGFGYQGYNAWLAIGFAYATTTSANVTMALESSPDGTTWTTRVSYTGIVDQQTLWWPVVDWAQHTQLRMTIVVNNGVQLTLKFMKLLSSRPDTYASTNAVSPIAWDVNKRLGLGTGSSVPTTGVVQVGGATTDSSGGLNFGGDTYLYRMGSNALKTAGSFSISGQAQFGGALSYSATTDTANTTLTSSSLPVRYADASTGAITYTLPSVTTAGLQFSFKKKDASDNTVTLAGAIDGATNYVLNQTNQAVTIMSTSTAGMWYTVNSTGNAVDLTSNQAIGGVKTFSGAIIAPDVYSYQVSNTAATNFFVDNNATNLPLVQPLNYNWYDIFAFNSKATPALETSTDGSTWAAGTLMPGIFIGEGQALTGDRQTIVANSYVRWTWGINMSWASNNNSWLYIGTPYSSSTSPVFVATVQSSSDGTTWTTRSTASNISKQQTGIWLRVNTWSGDSQLRVIIQTTNASTMYVSRLALYTDRPDIVVNGADKPIVFNASRRLGLGTGTLPATAMVRIGDDTTTSTGGMQFGSDTYLFRSGSNGLATSAGLSIGGDLGIGGAFYPGALTRTATLSIGIHDKMLNYANASSGAMTLTLPSTTSPGVMFTIKKVDNTSNTVTIAGTIDGATNYTLTAQNQAITLTSTATAGSWYTVSTNGANMSSATGVLPIANGGTGSSTQNFVDLTTAQNIAGNKTFTSVMRMTAGVKMAGQVYTTNVTLDWTKPQNALVDAASGAVSVILTATVEIGLTFTIKKIDSSSNTVTIAGTIDGVTNYVLSAQYSWVTIISTSTSGVWYITGKG